MRQYAPLPTWFRVLFVFVMLLLCVFLCWYAPSQYQLDSQRRDVALSLDTSRQREAKQTWENNKYNEALPQVESELALTQPLADEAHAREQALRTQRKELRAHIAQLDEQLAALAAQQDDHNKQAAALRLEIGRLRSTLDALQQALPQN